MLAAGSRLLGLVLPVVIVTGCGSGTDRAESDAPKEKSTGELVVDGLTGRAAVEAGLQAKATIKAVSTERNKDLSDVMAPPARTQESPGAAPPAQGRGTDAGH